MYDSNLHFNEMTYKQKQEIFSIDELKKLMKKIKEKKENEEMTNLVNTLEVKLERIFNKIQQVDEKAAAYKLSEQGEVIRNLIEALDVTEKDIDASLESFEKTEDSIGRAMERIKEQATEAWLKMQEDCEELVAVDEEPEEDECDCEECEIEPLPNGSLSDIGRIIQYEIEEEQKKEKKVKQLADEVLREFAKEIVRIRKQN